MNAALTASEQGKGYERPKLRLEALHKRRKGEDIEEGMEEARMEERVRIKAVHWMESFSQHLPKQTDKSQSIVRVSISVTYLCLN